MNLILLHKKGWCVMKNYCEKCGTELIDGVCPKCVQNATKAENKNEGKYKRLFMSPNEKLVTVLGNSYVENFFQDGTVRNGFAVVSDKRAYFQGNNYYISHDAKGNKKVIKNQQSRTVDLKDVTGTGTDSYSNIAWKIWGVISLIIVVLGLITFWNMTAHAVAEIEPVSAGTTSIKSVSYIWLLLLLIFPIFCFFMYQRSKVSLITIQYAGGEIGFDKNWFTQQEIDLFQKQLRLAKDKAIEASENAVANKLQEAVASMAQSASSSNSKADELTKLVDLLQKGVITQEEFNKMKKEMI